MHISSAKCLGSGLAMQHFPYQFIIINAGKGLSLQGFSMPWLPESFKAKVAICSEISILCYQGHSSLDSLPNNDTIKGIVMALSADTRPHFTTIAEFISSMDKEIIQTFRDILLICDDQGLIGKEMFAIDGCKLPSNASKEWSGTKADFEKKAVKVETAISRILKRHREVEPVLHCTQHEKDSTLWARVCITIRENCRMLLK